MCTKVTEVNSINKTLIKVLRTPIKVLLIELLILYVEILPYTPGIIEFFFLLLFFFFFFATSPRPISHTR